MKWLIKLVIVGSLCWGGACARDLPGEDPPEQSFYFPIGVATANDRYIYVANSNFDLRYNTGWITVVDTYQPLAIEQAVVGQRKILPFAGDLAQSNTHLLVGHRGRGQATLLEITDGGADLNCGNGSATHKLDTDERRTDCDENFILQITGSDANGEISTSHFLDPYPALLFTDPATNKSLAAVGYLDSGKLSVLEVNAGRPLSILTTVETSAAGLAGLALQPGTTQPLLIASSKQTIDRITSTSLYSVDISAAMAAAESGIVVAHAVGRELGGTEAIGVAFSPDGNYAYVANRRSDALLILSTSLQTVEQKDDVGNYVLVQRPSFAPLGALALGRSPSGLTYVDRQGAPDLVAVSCFDDDLLYIFEVEGGTARLVSRLGDLGRGPFAVRYLRTQGRDWLAVSVFFDHALSIVDVSSTSPDNFGLIAKLKSPETKAAERR